MNGGRQSSCRPRALSDDRFDAKLKPSREIGLIRPGDAVVLADVEVEIVDVVLAAAPYDWQVQAQRKARLEVHTRLLLGEVGHDESRPPDPCDDLIVDAVAAPRGP